MGLHHTGIEQCCGSCNEEEEVWWVHVQGSLCHCFNPRGGATERLEAAEGFVARVCTQVERDGDY